MTVECPLPALIGNVRILGRQGTQRNYQVREECHMPRHPRQPKRNDHNV